MILIGNLNPRGEEYYWIGLHPLIWKPSSNKDCDFEAIKANYVSITPIMLDMTSYNDIKSIENWLKNKRKQMNFTNSLLKHIDKLVGTLRDDEELKEVLKRKFTKKSIKYFVAFEEGIIY